MEAWNRFFTATIAACSRVVPYFAICSESIKENTIVGKSPLDPSYSSASRSKSLQRQAFLVRAEVNFSAPNASAISYKPDWIANQDSQKATELLEHMFSTLAIGIPVMPTVCKIWCPASIGPIDISTPTVPQ